MKAPAFLRAIVESFNPARYKGLTQRSMPKTIAYFFAISIIYLLLLGLINIPSYVGAYKNFDSKLGNFEKLAINIDIATKEPVVLSRSPKIVIDTNNERNISGEDILISETNITKKFFWIEKSVQVNHINLLENIDKVKRNSLFLILIFVPAIIALVYSFIIIKYALIIILFMLIGAFILLLIGQKSTTSEVFKAAVYALTVYFTANIFTSIFKIKYLGIIIYGLYFILVIILMREEKYEFHEDEEG